MNKLNLGCGYEKISGLINIDNNPLVEPDIILDLNKYPYPFENNSVDEVRLFHFLEHVRDQERFFEELRRICVVGAKVIVEVPFGTNGFNAIQHKNYYNWDTLYNLNIDGFELKHIEGRNRDIRNIIPKGLRRIVSMFFPILLRDLYAELEVTKKTVYGKKEDE